jgi:hypothetical protein
MNTLMSIAAVAVLTGVTANPVDGPLAALEPQRIESVRINLNPRGAELGFELELAGQDPRTTSLIALIRGATPGGGHRCANAGAIRIRMTDGRKIGVGLLPSHQEGVYELRLYDGEDYIGAYRVDRASLLATLESIGVPIDDPAFRE